ncbi:MAG: HAMP domain-containing histidine kinase [Methanomassiliicoccus sp.]|nr:MAG: HAMP domain-containing histidine kinase [Methanomassiliicoccus sp.]
MDGEVRLNEKASTGTSVGDALGDGRIMPHFRSILTAIASESDPTVLVERMIISLRSLLGLKSAVLWFEDHESSEPHVGWKTCAVGDEFAGIDGDLSERYRSLFVDSNLFCSNGYFSRSADIQKSSSRENDAPCPVWSKGDLLGIIVEGRTGKPVVHLVSCGEDGEPLPCCDDVDAAQLLLQMFGLELERGRERVSIVRDSDRMVRRTDMLEDILNIASSVVSERDLRKVSEMVLSSVASLFDFQRVTLVIYDEGIAAFKWVALYGYPEQTVKRTLARTIPTDVILEDLRESRKIGRTTFFIPMEDVPKRNLEYFVNPHEFEGSKRPREEGEFRDGDSLPFALYDSTGRVVGVIYPAAPKDGRIPDSDTIEIIEVFASLAEVAIENARLSHEKEVALRLSSLRTEQLSRIFDITSNILYLRDIDEMLEDVLKTLAHLLGIKRMVLPLRGEDGQQFDVRAVYGFDVERAEAIKKTSYPSDRIETISEMDLHRSLDSSVLWCKKVGRMTYYVPAESVRLEPWEMIYYPEPDLLKLPRKSKEYWHELDYLDTLIFDSQGKTVAYLEILKPRDDRIPDRETIEIIEIFASLVGISLENAHMVQGHIVSRRNAEFYTDLLSHDIKNFNQAILGYLDILKSTIASLDQEVYIDKIMDQVMNISKLAADVRTMSRITWSDSKLAKTDLGKVLLESIQSVEQYYLNRKIVFKKDMSAGPCYVKADELIRELFVNILTNAIKYDSSDPVEIEISMTPSEDEGIDRIVVSVTDKGRGVPDDLKLEIFQRFSRAPTKKGSGLGLYLVKTLTSKYGGRVWAEDRVAGDHTKGAVFRVELPMLKE